MRATAVRGTDLRTYRLLQLLAAATMIFLAALAIAPARSHYSEWRAHQQRYNALAVKQGHGPTELKLHQVWKPELGVTDRCASCHVGMGKAEAVGGAPLFRAHPAMPHEAAEFGCTICHGGQGRATRAAAAHGDAAHWDEPLVERPHLQSACGVCHGAIALPARAALDRGRAQVERADCSRCHQLDGVGRSAAEGAKGGDLSTVGLRGLPADWHPRHLARRAAAAPAERALWTASYGPLGGDEVAAITAYLGSCIGAPRFVAAKVLVHERGCRGCHKIRGVGGDEGPDLSNEGRRPTGDLDFSRVAGPRTLSRWLTAQVTDPGRLTPGSTMPNLGLTSTEAELVTLYLHSLRSQALPLAQTTREQVRLQKLKEREFPTDGASLFGAFCAGCHGPRGEGRRFGSQPVVFPAIGSADFLALASDAMLRRAIRDGRAGRKMPAWGTKEGGLRPDEVQALVAFVRALAAPRDVAREAQAVAIPVGRGDARRGAAMFATCQGCHGARGRGGAGPAIGLPTFLAQVDDRYLAGTILRGRRGTSMPGFAAPGLGYRALDAQEALDLVAHLRTLAGGR